MGYKEWEGDKKNAYLWLKWPNGVARWRNPKIKKNRGRGGGWVREEEKGWKKEENERKINVQKSC